MRSYSLVRKWLDSSLGSFCNLGKLSLQRGFHTIHILFIENHGQRICSFGKAVFYGTLSVICLSVRTVPSGADCAGFFPVTPTPWLQAVASMEVVQEAADGWRRHVGGMGGPCRDGGVAPSGACVQLLWGFLFCCSYVIATFSEDLSDGPCQLLSSWSARPADGGC